MINSFLNVSIIKEPVVLMHYGFKYIYRTMISGQVMLYSFLSVSAIGIVAQNKPNVVIFLTDDQGYSDMNRYGSTDIETPNMDKICDEGVRFTHFYANSSISSPTRAALLTGRYPQRAGMGALASSHEGTSGMPTTELTIAEVLKQAGYKTGIVGKWHLGYTPETMPNGQGFDYSFGNMGGCIDNYSHYFHWSGASRHDLWCNGKEVWYEGKNYSDLMVDKATQFIRDNKKQPFFLYFSSNYPHYPLQGDAKWREYYQQKKVTHPRDKYAAMVSTADEKIGLVIRQLEKSGVRDNTIVIFMSDNGYSTEDRTFGGGGSAANLRGAKFSCYEGGIRVPAMISYPKELPKQVVCNQIATGVDWFPTILELCNVSLPHVKLDGVSLVKQINSNVDAGHKIICWHVGEWCAVRKGNYKLVFNKKQPNSAELYDFNKDETEKNNIAVSNPDVVEELKHDFAAWQKDVSTN